MELRAQDLRIGNWFIDHEADPQTSIYWQVESIERVSSNPNQKHLGVRFRNGSCWSSISIIEPIPLTEEWLVKFGFQLEHKEGNQGSFRVYRKAELVYNSSHKAFWYNGRILENAPLDYIHQIQNLFYCLCGEELEIKE